MKPIAICLFLACLYGIGQAQTRTIPVVEVENVSFASDFERKTLSAYDVDLLHLFLGPNSETGSNLNKAQEMLSTIEDKLRKPIAKKKTLEKQLEVITRYLHDNYLKQYREVANFQELLASGTYNCVTAVALHALTFDRLGIPFQVYEQPNHVYLVAGDANPVMVETTVESDGLFIPDERFQRRLVNMLRDNKIISAEEVEEKGVAAVFKDNYISDVKINLRQLAGLQYMNDALLMFEENDFDGAMRQYKKAYLLYPTANCHMLLFSVATMQLAAAGGNPEKAMDRSIEAFRLQPDYLDFAALRKEVSKSCITWLQQHHEKSDLERVHEKLKRIPNDTLTPKEVSYYYHAVHIDEAEAFRKYDTAYAHARAAFLLFPDRVRMQGKFVDLRTLTLAMKGPQILLDSLAMEERRYPFFKESEFAHSMKYTAFAQFAVLSFLADDRRQGDAYLAKMDSMNTARPVQDKDHAAGEAYAAAVNSYVRIVNYKKARYYLLMGLDIAPYNEKLVSYKRIYKRELNIQ